MLPISLLNVDNSYQHMAALMLRIAQNRDYIICVRRPNNHITPLLIEPYKPTDDTISHQKVVSITTLTPSLAEIVNRPHIKNIQVLDINSGESSWKSALYTVVEGNTALFLKKNHRIVAEILTLEDSIAKKMALHTPTEAKQDLYSIIQKPAQSNKPDGYIGSDIAIAKMQKKQFDGWQKINDKGLVLSFTSTTWAAIKQQEHRLMWAVNDKNYPHLTMSSRGRVCLEGAYAYLKRANDVAWCGYTDWRLPTVDELLSLIVHKHSHTDNLLAISEKNTATNKAYQALALQSPYYEKPSLICLRTDYFNDIPHNQEDGEHLSDAYYVWTSTVGLSQKRSTNHPAVVSFAHNSRQRIIFDTQEAYVRLVRSY